MCAFRASCLASRRWASGPKFVIPSCRANDYSWRIPAVVFRSEAGVACAATCRITRRPAADRAYHPAESALPHPHHETFRFLSRCHSHDRRQAQTAIGRRRQSAGWRDVAPSEGIGC
jgi:hypothetical protein